MTAETQGRSGPGKSADRLDGALDEVGEDEAEGGAARTAPPVPAKPTKGVDAPSFFLRHTGG